MTLTIIIIVLVLVVLAVVGFAFVQRKRRAGGIIAQAPRGKGGKK